MDGQPKHKRMKPLNNNLILYRSNKFKNLSIILGVFLSIFLVSSYNSQDGSENSLVKSEIPNIEQNSIDKTISNENQSTKYHNFLASYFMQESSVKRENRKTEEKRSVFNNLKDLHHIITTGRQSLF